MQRRAVTTRIVRWPIEPRGAARGRWTERVAVVIGIRGPDGATGLGEAAPLLGMSIDTIEEVIEDLDQVSSDCRLGDTQFLGDARNDSAGFGAGTRDPMSETRQRALALATRVTNTPAARFAVETALLVLVAQRARRGVAALWRPDPGRELRCAIVVDDPEEARFAVARGASCLKIKGGDPDRVAQIARAAPTARLRIDANRSWPRAEVHDRLAVLAAFPIDFVEEPCVDAHELLASPLPCRIALDESIATLDRADLDRALRSPDLAALVLKPTLLGGFARCLELADLARAADVAPIVTHSLEGPIGTAACIELARVIGGDIAVGLAPHPGVTRFAEAA